jgi:hypothetical protein
MECAANKVLDTIRLKNLSFFSLRGGFFALESCTVSARAKWAFVLKIS